MYNSCGLLRINFLSLLLDACSFGVAVFVVISADVVASALLL